MQQSDERRSAGRPSLLSEQPPAADTQSILNKLDGRAGPARASAVRPRSRRLPIIAAVGLLGAAALAWLLGADPVAERPVVMATVAPAPAAAPVVPAAAVTPKVLATADTEPEVSAATILDEVPNAAPPSKTPALADSKAATFTEEGKDELTALLDKPAAKEAVKESPKEAIKETPKEANKPIARKKSEPVKVAHKEKSREKDAKSTVAAARKKVPAAKAPPQMDSDVALLAALLAHSKATSAPRLSKTAAEYKRCGTLPSVADADKCRERLCSGAKAKAKAECKSLGAAKVSS